MTRDQIVQRGQKSDRTDRRRRQDALAVGFVVKRHVADTIGKSSARHASPVYLQRADELAHDSGFSGLPKFRLSVVASGRAPTADRLR